MNLLTYMKHLAGSGAIAYYYATQIRDPKTRPDFLAGFQLVESSTVPFLTVLSARAAAEGDTWLAEKLAKHALEETIHAKILAQAVKPLKKSLLETQIIPTNTNESQSKQGRTPFSLYFEGYSEEQIQPEVIDWDVFMGSTYILELDASKDFMRMANVLPDGDPTTRSLKLGILSIAKDETRHAAYLYEAMMRRMPATKVQKLVDKWRTQKVNALLASVGDIIQSYSEKLFIEE